MRSGCKALLHLLDVYLRVRDCKRCHHHAAGSELLGKLARVYSGYSRDSLLVHPLVKRHEEVPVACHKGQLVDHQPPDLYPVRLEEFGDSVSINCAGIRNAIVSNQGVRECQDLAVIRGISQRLGIPDHPGIEYNLAKPCRGAAKPITVKNGSVVKNQLSKLLCVV